MKKELLIVCLMILPHIAFSQTEKGNFFVGAGLIGNSSGNIPFSNAITLVAQKDNFQLFVKPVFGYFLNKNFVIGTGISFGSINTTSTTNEPSFYGTFGSLSSSPYNAKYYYFESLQQKSNYYGVSPFIKYYLGNHKFRPSFIVGWDCLSGKGFVERIIKDAYVSTNGQLFSASQSIKKERCTRSFFYFLFWFGGNIFYY